jgi:hypothetical protein
MRQLLTGVLLELIDFTTRERGTLLFIWTWPIRRQRVAYHKHFCWTIQVKLSVFLKKPPESLVSILSLSTFSTIVHRAFEADMRLMAVGNML